MLAALAFLRSGGVISLPPHPWHVLGLGASYFSFQTCWMWGLELTTPFIAAISSLMIPVFSMLVSRCVGTEQLSAVQIAGTIYTVLGCGLCIPEPSGRDQAVSLVVGTAILLTCCACFVGLVLIQQSLMQSAKQVAVGADPPPYQAWLVFSYTIVCIPLALVHCLLDGSAFDGRLIESFTTFEELSALLYFVIAGTVAYLELIAIAGRHLQPTMLTLCFAAEPLVVTILQYFCYADGITWLQLFGYVVTAWGVHVIASAPSEPAKPSTRPTSDWSVDDGTDAEYYLMSGRSVDANSVHAGGGGDAGDGGDAGSDGVISISRGGSSPPLRFSLRLSYLAAPSSERRAAWLGLAVSALAGFGNGFNLSVLDLPAVRRTFSLDDLGLGLVSSSIMCGVTLSSLVGGAAADAVGRVPVALVGEAVLLVGVASSALAPSAALLVGAQVVAGIGAGICAVAKPLWVVESAPPWARGTLLASWSLFFSAGMGAASLARLWLPAGFRGSVALGMLPPLLLGGLFASGLAAETPAYVQMRRERRRSAEEEGGQLAAPGATQPSAASAPATAPASASDTSAYVAAAALAWLAAVPGDAVIKSALPLTLAAIGFDPPPEEGDEPGRSYEIDELGSGADGDAGDVAASRQAASLLNLANLVGVAMATSLVDTVGRRTLLLRGGVASCLGLLGAAAWGAMAEHGAITGTTAQAFVSTAWLSLYVLGLEAGPLSMFWVMAPNLFDTHARGFGLAFGVTVLHALQVAIAAMYPVALGAAPFWVSALALGAGFALGLALLGMVLGKGGPLAARCE